MTLKDCADFPTPGSTNPGPFYCRTTGDLGAGTEWGRVIGKMGHGVYALTPGGVRFYVSGALEVIGPDDPSFARVHEAWAAVLEMIGVVFPPLAQTGLRNS